MSHFTTYVITSSYVPRILIPEGSRCLIEQGCYPLVRCTAFTGKDPRIGWRTPLNYIIFSEQRDEETGFGYFGARYYDADLMTMWLSVDPMADKYPGISPYAYCAWNPVKLVDPDGMEIWIGIYGKSSKYTPLELKDNKAQRGGIAGRLDEIYSTKAGKFVMDKLIQSDNRYFITNDKHSDKNNPCYDPHNSTIYLNNRQHYGLISHELFHAFQHNEGVEGHNRANEVEAFIFSGIVMRQHEGTNWYKNMPAGMNDAFDGRNSKGANYENAMFELTAIYTQKKYVSGGWSVYELFRRRERL